MKSMTGYGRHEFRLNARKVTLEVKTVNHRFCEVHLRLPSRYSSLEAELIEFSRKSFGRGRIDIFVREGSSSNTQQVRVHEEQLDHYLKLIQKLEKKWKKTAPLQLENLLSLPQVLTLEEEQEDLKQIQAVIFKNFELVFDKVQKVREKEGSSLKKEFLERLKTLHDQLSRVEKKIPEMLKDYEARLRERIARLLQQLPDEWRLAQEIAHFVERTDVSEEIQRFKSHLVHFKEVLNEKEPVGRKLDFILQEMNREVNTLGSKVQEVEITRLVVACKHELEKLREQVQNVE